MLPIRGTRFGESTILIASAALSVAAWALLIRHQRRHFGASSRYWLKIDREQLTIVTPDNEETYDWRNVTRFVIEKDERTTMDTKKPVEISVTG